MNSGSGNIHLKTTDVAIFFVLLIKLVRYCEL